MKVHIPNSAFLGNLDPFLQGIDPSAPESLEITANQKWNSIHPIVFQTKEFSILLDAIRRTYSEAVRERKKSRFKRPRFI